MLIFLTLFIENTQYKKENKVFIVNIFGFFKK